MPATKAPQPKFVIAKQPPEIGAHFGWGMTVKASESPTLSNAAYKLCGPGLNVNWEKIE